MFGQEAGLLPSATQLVFVQNHDTERNGSSLNDKDASNLVATHVMLAYPYGRPQVCSGFTFGDDTNQSPPSDANGFITDTDCGTAPWNCTTRNPGVEGMVRFHDRGGQAPVRDSGPSVGATFYARRTDGGAHAGGWTDRAPPRRGGGRGARPERTMTAPADIRALGVLRLEPNQPERVYRGGAGIARFRGLPPAGEWFPEDFVGSTTEVFGGGAGLSVLPTGDTVRAAVEADPVWFLGEQHVARFGTSTELLVKLLDPAERLFAHVHPTDAFAAERLGSPHGKTEAWIVVDAPPGGGYALVGFREAVSAEQVDAWVADQDVDALLGALQRVPLLPGDSILVPAGTVHAIGPGLLIAELQQPSDLSILLEWQGFERLTAADASMGLDRQQVLAATDTTALPQARIAELMAQRPQGYGTTALFPPEADPFFRAERITVSDPVDLDPGFAVLLVLSGEGRASWDGGAVPLRAGRSVLVPFGVGTVRLDGDATVLRCRPPAPRPPA